MPYISNKIPQMIYGADYNPEQWPEEVWDEDVRLMQEAGVNLISLGIFGWAKLNPSPDAFEFGWLDRVVEKLHAGGIKINMATATATPPAWLGRLYPEIRPVDQNGTPYAHGGRQGFTPNSKVFVDHAVAMCSAIAERYAKHPAVVMWHINNEYFGNAPTSYGEVDAEAFRVWLKSKYGTLDALNEAWTTTFWSQWYYEWEEINPPRLITTEQNPTMHLDYTRFFSDAYIDLYRAELAAVRAHAPETPMATNFFDPVFARHDQQKMAQLGDFGAMDSYPEADPTLDDSPSMCADMARSLLPKKPWILMEQVTSQTQWRDYNSLKRPGVMRLWSLSHVARGSDGAMFFQWRQSKGASEKFHGAMLPIVGTKDSRVWREVCDLGAELKKLAPVAGSLPVPDIAILHGYENAWALQSGDKPRKFHYFDLHRRIHRSCWEMGMTPDYVHPDCDSLDRYPFLIVPCFYLLTQEQIQRIRRYVEGGGTLLMTYFSGLVDGNEQFYQDGGFPGGLQDVMGFRVEEWDVLSEGHENRMVFEDGTGVPCDHMFEIGQLRGGKALATYEQDFYAGSPVLTEHSFGKGRAYYLASRPANKDAWKTILKRVVPAEVLQSPVDAPERVEGVIRRGDNGERFLFLLNYTGESTRVGLKELSGIELLTSQKAAGEWALKPNGVAVIELN